MHTLIWQNEPVSLPISIARGTCALGDLWCASTPLGICQLEFIIDNDTQIAEAYLKKNWENCPIAHGAQTLDTQQLLTQSQTLHVRGTQFQQTVWRELIKIPHGETCSYGDIAQAIDNPKAFRAVGSAVGKNPTAVLIPCHRVLAANRKIGGFYWGTAMKKRLLEAEGIYC